MRLYFISNSHRELWEQLLHLLVNYVLSCKHLISSGFHCRFSSQLLNEVKNASCSTFSCIRRSRPVFSDAYSYWRTRKSPRKHLPVSSLHFTTSWWMRTFPFSTLIFFSSFRIQGRSAHIKAQFIPQQKLKETFSPQSSLCQWESGVFLVGVGVGFHERKTNLSSSAWLWRHPPGVESWDSFKSRLLFSRAELWGCKKLCTTWKRCWKRVWMMNLGLSGMFKEGFMASGRINASSECLKPATAHCVGSWVFLSRRHRTNCHVLHVPRKKWPIISSWWQWVSDDFSKTQELESKDQFPFELPVRTGTETPCQGGRRLWQESVQVWGMNEKCFADLFFSVLMHLILSAVLDETGCVVANLWQSLQLLFDSTADIFFSYPN